MRLTLRTMLAYLDDVLDPGDSQELGEKIEESTFATDLVHRIRNSMRHLRLGAPKVDGKGMGVDANSVAEYLDSTLAAERVPDFEKVCLESDVHLAEVASCHQILTIVLGEPAAFEPSLRDRVYQLGHPQDDDDEVAAPPIATEPEEPPVVVPGGPAGSNGSSKKHENGKAEAESSEAESTGESQPMPAVKTKRGARDTSANGIPFKSLAITLLLGFLIAFVTLQIIGPNGIQGLFGGPTPEVATGQPQQTPLTNVIENSTAGETTGAPQANAEPPTVPTPSVEEEVMAEPVEEPAGVSLPESNVDLSAAAPLDPDPVEAAAPTPEPTVDSPPAAASEPSALGRFLTEEQVLARLDREREVWMPMAMNSAIVAGDELTSLPTFRPQVLLADGLKMTLYGGARLAVGNAEPGGGPEIVVHHGRLTLIPVGGDRADVSLQLPNRNVMLSFPEMDSQAALEVRYFTAAGSDPEATPSLVVVEMHAIGGSVAWAEGDRKLECGAGQVVAVAGEDAAQLFMASEPPAWMSADSMSYADRMAWPELRKHLSQDRPLSLTLLEQAKARRQEVQALARRSLCLLNMFDPAIESLDDERHHAYWTTHVDALKQSMARSPESAAKIKETIEKLTGESAPAIHRMLRGYSSEQLDEGGAEELVDYLDNESMALRVLAYENLRRITGKTQTFRPEEAAGRQKTKVLKWRKDLENDLIRYREEATPLPEREAVGGVPE